MAAAAAQHPLGPLAPLAEYRQFIVAQMLPLPNGKTKKVPVDPATGFPCDAHDPQHHTDYGTAVFEAAIGTAKTGLRHGVGFDLRASDDFVVIDIDGALQDDRTWHPLVQEILNKLPGSVAEISQSGKGVHIWARHPAPPPHRTKTYDWALRLECYSAGQYILLGTQQTGTLAPRCDAVPAVLAEYFAPRPATSAADVPDEGPCEGYAGPADDEVLIDRMLRSTSNAAVFRGKASVQDLWNREVGVLARTYPGDGDGGVDWSSADGALAAHLAWWTGKDVERIDRLMRRSGLDREKWKERPDWLTNTIVGACKIIEGFYVPPPSAPRMTLEAAMKSLHGLSTTKATEVWVATALALNHGDADEFLHTVALHTGQGRQALKATLREARRGQAAAGSIKALEARAQGRMQFEHLPDQCTLQAGQVEAEIARMAAPGEYVSFGGVACQVTTKSLPYTHMVDDPEAAPPAVPVIEPLGAVQMLAHVERAAMFYDVRRDGGRKALAVPPRIIDTLLGKDSHHCPTVNGLVTHPLVLRNGQTLEGEGLHAESGLYLHGATVEGVRPLTQAEARQALAWLRSTFLEGFEFARPLDRDAALAGLLTGIQRRVLDSAPGLAVLAAAQSSGKTTLARRIHIVLTGRDMPAATFSLGNEAEVSKSLLSMLLRSPAMVCFDNVPDGYTFKSGALAAAMTSALMEQRVLGASKDATVPTNTLFALTGNNLSLGNDEVTRWLVVKLAPKGARPESRVFAFADVMDHALTMRADVLRMAVGIVGGYAASGTSMATATRFPVWDRMVRQALIWAGGEDVAAVFRENAEKSEPVRAHRAIVAQLLQLFPGVEFAASDVAEAAARHRDLREGLEALGTKDPGSSKGVGRVLAAKNGTAVEIEGREYVITRFDDRLNIGRYRVGAA